MDLTSFSVKNQLKYLSISGDEENDEHHKVLMKNLLGATQLLEKLSIQGWGRSFYFQPNIIQNKHTLTVLRIYHILLSFESVKSIFTNCLELTEVNLEVRVT